MSARAARCETVRRAVSRVAVEASVLRAYKAVQLSRHRGRAVGGERGPGVPGDVVAQQVAEVACVCVKCVRACLRVCTQARARACVRPGALGDVVTQQVADDAETSCDVMARARVRVLRLVFPS